MDWSRGYYFSQGRCDLAIVCSLEQKLHNYGLLSILAVPAELPCYWPAAAVVVAKYFRSEAQLKHWPKAVGKFGCKLNILAKLFISHLDFSVRTFSELLLLILSVRVFENLL